MKERLLACVLALALLLGTTCVAMGESTYSARTRIYDDDKRQNIALAALEHDIRADLLARVMLSDIAHAVLHYQRSL